MIRLLYITCLLFAISTGQARADSQIDTDEPHFGNCTLTPEMLVSAVFDIVVIHESVGFQQDQFIPPWYQLWSEADWPYEPQAYGRYFGMDNSVHLNLKAMAQFSPMEACSIIVHEITHSLQFQALGQVIEEHAYFVQRVFLDSQQETVPMNGNGLAHNRFFKRLQRQHAHDGHHDLESKAPEFCTGDDKHKACVW